MKVGALLVSGVNTIATGEAEIPSPGPGEVLVRTAYSGISPGTELRKMSGVEGDAFPYIPGYTQTGVIEQVGEGVVGLTPGRKVWCSGTLDASVSRVWGGHIGYAVRSASAVIPLPDNVDMVEASIVKLAAIAYHGLRLARPLPHETVAVIGLGPIGQCAARVYAAAGATVLGVDLSPERVALVKEADVIGEVPKTTIADAVRDVFPEGADIVVDCTGVVAVLAQSVECAKDLPWNLPLTVGARLLLQGSYPDAFTMPYPSTFRKELNILVPRDHLMADITAVLNLMARRKLSLRELVTEVREIEQAQATYDELRTTKGRLLTVAFRWNEF